MRECVNNSTPPLRPLTPQIATLSGCGSPPPLPIDPLPLPSSPSNAHLSAAAHRTTSFMAQPWQPLLGRAAALRHASPGAHSGAASPARSVETGPAPRSSSAMEEEGTASNRDGAAPAGASWPPGSPCTPPSQRRHHPRTRRSGYCGSGGLRCHGTPAASAAWGADAPATTGRISTRPRHLCWSPGACSDQGGCQCWQGGVGEEGGCVGGGAHTSNGGRGYEQWRATLAARAGSAMRRLELAGLG